jgi:outer membrane receptor protein involved in Fe transport
MYVYNIKAIRRKNGRGRRMMRAKSRQSAVRIALLATVLAFPAAVAAQETPADVSAQADESQNRDIVVTGSRLRRPAADGASPISVTDREARRGQAHRHDVDGNMTSDRHRPQRSGGPDRVARGRAAPSRKRRPPRRSGGAQTTPARNAPTTSTCSCHHRSERPAK